MPFPASSSLNDATGNGGAMTAYLRFHNAMPHLAALVIGLLLANLSVFVAFVIFNFILHLGA